MVDWILALGFTGITRHRRPEMTSDEVHVGSSLTFARIVLDRELPIRTFVADRGHLRLGVGVHLAIDGLGGHGGIFLGVLVTLRKGLAHDVKLVNLRGHTFLPLNVDKVALPA